MELVDLQESLNESYELNKESYEEFFLSKAYYEGYQLDSHTMGILQARGQPPIFENIYAMIAEKVLGYKINGSTEIQAIGFQKEDKPTAEILTNILKSITQTKEYQTTKQKCDLDLMHGICAAEVWLKQTDDNNLKITIRHIPLKSLYIDPYSQKEDCSDSKYFHKVLYMEENEAILKYGKRDYEVVSSFTSNNRKRVRIIESFIYNAKTNRFDRYIWDTYSIFLKEKSLFDMPFCPIVVRKLKIDSKNNFFGIFRNVKPLQDSINFTENRINNMLGSQKILYEKSAIDNEDEFIEHVSLDNAVVGVRDGAISSGRIQFQNHSNDIASLSSKAEQKRILAKMQAGFNDEALGQNMGRASTAVVQARTNAGLVGIQSYLTASDLFDKQVFQVCIEFITKYFTKQQIFTIVEQDTFQEYFEVNSNENNKIKVGHYDINIETKARSNSTREERFTQWVELIKSGFIPQELMSDIIPLILDDSDSNVANKVKKVILEKQEAQGQNPMEEQIQQLQMQMQELNAKLLQAQVHEKEAKARKYLAQAQSEDIKLPKGDK